MKQTKEELESWYAKEDPWDYKVTKDDLWRKQIIIHVANLFGPYSRALDIGCGEGFVTRDLPASTKHGYEISDLAASRFPVNVNREKSGLYDLLVVTGVLYAQYEWGHFVGLINAHASRIVLICNIKNWEVQAALRGFPGRQVFEAEFPYREYTQKLRVFDVSLAPNRP